MSGNPERTGVLTLYTRLDHETQPGLPFFGANEQKKLVLELLGTQLQAVLQNKASRNTFVQMLRLGINVDDSNGADRILKTLFDRFTEANGIDDVSQMSEIDVLSFLGDRWWEADLPYDAGFFVALSTYVTFAKVSLMKLPDSMPLGGGGVAMEDTRMPDSMPLGGGGVAMEAPEMPGMDSQMRMPRFEATPPQMKIFRNVPPRTEYMDENGKYKSTTSGIFM